MNDAAVLYGYDAVSFQRGLFIVGNEYDGLVQTAVGELQHIEDLPGVLPVQVPGRFICQKQGGAVDQGAGDGGTLLLSAGQLVRQRFQSVGDPQSTYDRIKIYRNRKPLRSQQILPFLSSSRSGSGR